MSKIKNEEEIVRMALKPITAQLKPVVPRAISVIEQYLSGIEVNKTKLKVATDVLKEARGFEQAKNNRMAQERENKNFNLKLFTMFGDEAHKTEIKEVFKKEFKKLKFVEI